MNNRITPLIQIFQRAHHLHNNTLRIPFGNMFDHLQMGLQIPALTKLQDRAEGVIVILEDVEEADDARVV